MNEAGRVAETIEASELLRRISRMILEHRARGIPAPEPQSGLGAFDAGDFKPMPEFPWRRPAAPREDVILPIKQRARCYMDELLASDGIVFVGNCFRCLLARDPDPAEAQLALSNLERGWPKALIVAQLRFSLEGRRTGVRVPGLAFHLARAGAREYIRRGPKPFIRRATRVLRRVFAPGASAP